MGTFASIRNSPIILRAWPWCEFLGAFAFLNAVANLRFPGSEPPFFWLVPSLDVVVVFTTLALFAWSGWKVPWVVRAGATLVFLGARFLRLGDGVSNRYFLQTFNVYSDLPLDDDSLWIVLGDHQPVPEVAMSSTLGVPVHVLSKNAALLEPFRGRGYTPGMRPNLRGARAAMADFLGAFLRDFSR